ncbi:tyrosine recombinase XerC [Vaginisenegalia massiliensis]|uniref:tyrosine recombinase XerC n=1 Tax=Vaginisenegalia massiliensis TaxID=2058294 RepID=UPI000F541164|nr:tyrosine recombinase XerC [Vaginisenegalia massiliensis]
MDQELNQFIHYLADERRYSNETVQAYQRDLDEFVQFIRLSQATPLAEISYQDMRLYLAHLNERGLAPNSISRKLSALRSFFRYCLKQSYIEANPMELIQFRPKEQRLPEFFYEKEVDQLLKAAANPAIPYPLRNRAIVEILYATGMRVSECCQLRLEQVNLTVQLIRVVGKGQKERIVPLGDAAVFAIQAYLDQERPDLCAKKDLSLSSDRVFLSDKGQELQPAQIRRLLNRIVKEAGLNIAIHPHKMRHTFATHLLNHGADMRSVQELLGHADLSSTQIYTHVTKDRLRKSYLAAHPRAHRQTKED